MGGSISSRKLRPKCGATNRSRRSTADEKQHIYTSSKDAAFVLVHMGPAGISVLTNIISNTNVITDWWVQLSAIWALGQHPEFASDDLPALIIKAAQANTTPGQYSTVRAVALWALGQLKIDASHSVPFLTNALADSFTSDHPMIIDALGEFGDQAAPAIPAIESKLSDPQLGASAKSALKKIDPEWKPR